MRRISSKDAIIPTSSDGCTCGASSWSDHEPHRTNCPLYKIKDTKQLRENNMEKCTITYHVVTDDGRHCTCGYFERSGNVDFLTNPDAKGRTDGEIDLFKDGDKLCAVYRPTFVNLQESPAGFGATETEALTDLVKSYERGYYARKL